MSDPLISIITPVYNGQAKIKATLDSVLSQKSDLFEYLVIDGGSTDGTLEELRSRGDRLKWISEPDRGIYDAMNKGVDRATGSYVYFLGAGDILRPGVLETIAPLLPLDGTFLVYGDVFWVSPDPPYGGAIYGGAADRRRMALGFLNHQSIFYSARIFENRRYDLRYKIVSDHVFNIVCFGDNRIQKMYVPVVVADYEGGGTSATVRDTQFERDHVKLVARHLGLGYAVLVALPRAKHRGASLLALLRYLVTRSPVYLAGRVLWHLKRKLGQNRPDR